MKKITIALLGFLFVASYCFADTVNAPDVTIKDKIISTFNDNRMVKVLTCESGLQQYKDGKPNLSPTADVGISQINQVHWKKALKLNLNIFFSIDDNLKMAKIIYDEQGITAWNAYQNACYKKLG